MKIEAGTAPFACLGDRFVPGGYMKGLEPERQFEEVVKTKGLTGVCYMFPNEQPDPVKLKKRMEEFNLKVGTICPDTYTTAYWKNGTLTNRDPKLRKEIIKTIKDSMDYCHEAGGADILLWLAHDGYDYMFEDDYRVRWDYLVDGLKEVASYRNDVKVTIEYKTKEPRTYQYISNVGKSLLLCNEVGAANFGVVLDIGHALFAGENPAESVALLDKYKRLFHVHLNDNYRSWDDDLLLGSIHFWETLEFFFWLNKVGYDGWFTIDIWPTRTDGRKSLDESIERANLFMSLAKSLPYDEIKKMQHSNSTMDIMKLLREHVLKNV